MAIDPLITWQNTFAALPQVADNSWALNFATWVYDRVVNIAMNPTQLTGTLTFIFNKTLFASQLATLTPTLNTLSGVTNFANAWETAILTTVFPTTLNVAAGAFIPPSTPATLFSVINSVILDPASIAAAKAKIIELATTTPTADPYMSEFPKKFREAFLLLTITVTGLDSTAPTPLPLIVNAVQLI